MLAADIHGPFRTRPRYGEATYTLPAPVAVTANDTIGLSDRWRHGGLLLVRRCGLPGGSPHGLSNRLSTPTPNQPLGLGGADSPSAYQMNIAATFVPTPPAEAKKKCKKKKKSGQEGRVRHQEEVQEEKEEGEVAGR